MWLGGAARGVGVVWGTLALGPSGESTLAGPALFFLLGREGQVP